MTGNAAYFKIGIFVLAASGLAIAAVIVLGAGALFQDTVPFETYVDESVQGLDVGAPVKYRGVTVGVVENISFVESKYLTHKHYVLLSCTFVAGSLGKWDPREHHSRLDQEIAEGLRVRIASSGLTGGMYLEIDYMDPKKYPPLTFDWTPDVVYVPSIPSTGARLLDSAEGVLDDIRRAEIDKIGEKLNAVLEALAKTINDDLAPAFKNIRETSEKLPGVIENLERTITVDLAGDLRNFLAILTTTAEQDLTPAIENIRIASQKLPRAIDRLDRTVKRVDHLIVGQESNLENTFESLRIVLDDVRDLSSRAKKHSSGVIFGDAPPRTTRGKK